MKTGTKVALIIVGTLIIGMSLAITTAVVGYHVLSSGSTSDYTDVIITTTDVVVKDIPPGRTIIFDMQDKNASGSSLSYYVTLKTATGQHTLEMPAQMGEFKSYFGIIQLEFSLKPGQGPVRARLRLVDCQL